MQASGGDSGGAPAWLFSFVDLAFLMLIAMTILANQNAGAPDLGEIVVPRIHEGGAEDLGASRGHVWQLRVHPPFEVNGALEPPFELIVVGGNAPAGTELEASAGQEAPEERIDRTKLREQLAILEARVGARPLLAPHEDSRSQDLLDAASAIEELWPNQRRAVIAKRIDG